MTSIVGVLCQDGVVMGTDSAATFGGTLRTIEQSTEKLDLIGGEVILAGVGSTGLRQRFRDLVEDAWKRDLFKKSRAIELGKYFSSNALQDFGSTRAPQGAFGAMLAFPCQDQPVICAFDPEHFQPELIELRLWYDSMGSAKPITDPFLALMRRAFWTDGPPLVYDAVFAVTWVLQHAIEINTGGVNGPLKVAVLEKHGGLWRTRRLPQHELLEHEQHVEEAYDALRKFRDQQSPRKAGAPPDIPGM